MHIVSVPSGEKVEACAKFFVGEFEVSVSTAFNTPDLQVYFNGESSVRMTENLFGESTVYPTAENVSAALAFCIAQRDIPVGERKLVGPWITDPQAEHCCMRVLQGGNPADVADRVAYIEKSPRVRVSAYSENDFRNWFGGPKGCGGDGEADATYGYYPPSRRWCDAQLVLNGYDLKN